jgi:hypothetical protein
MLYKLCLIGYGAANMLLAGHVLAEKLITPSDILLIDPHHDGGALLRDWAHVRSNTTYQQFLDALTLLGIPHPPCAPQYNPAGPTELRCLAHGLRQTVDTLLGHAKRVYSYVTRLEKTSTEPWVITAGKQTYRAMTVSLAIGAQPKALPTQTPQIPLSRAFTSADLSSYIRAPTTLTVFGAAHSGALIVQTAVQLGCRVNLVYNTPQPFYFADEGAYDGVKLETAVVARQILADGLGGKVHLIPYADALQVHSALLESSWCVSACGFELIHYPHVYVDGRPIHTENSLPYNPANAQIYPRLYGWGIAFPSTTTLDGRTYVDVSIPSFANHIYAQREQLRADITTQL